MSHVPRHSMPGMDADMDMGDSSSSNSTSGSSMMMTMVFQTVRATPLYANSWTPNSAAAYAGTCIFLVVLAILVRVLVTLKAFQEAKWQEGDEKRRYVAVNGKGPLSEQIARDPNAKQMMVMSENGIEETVVVVERKACPIKPWRFSVDPLRAVLDTVIVGIGYLLMLAVMTMNVGYFMSVLAGVFIGSLALGRYSAIPAH